MRPALLACATAVLLSACAYQPKAPDPLQIDDSPADIRACRRLGVVSHRVPTTPDLNPKLDRMIEAAKKLGATDLYLRRGGRDWSYIQGIAYRCRDSRFRPGSLSHTEIKVRL